MGGMKADDLTRLRKELSRRGYDPSKMSMNPSGPAGKIIQKVAGEIGIMFDPPRIVKKKDGGLMAAIRKVDAEKKFKDGKTVKADPTFEAMIKRKTKPTLMGSLLAKTGLMDKKDKVTHPMEVKKFSQGASVEVEMNRGNTTKNFKGSF